MSLELVERIPFWSNPGTDTITGLGHSTLGYLAPGGTALGGGAASDWKYIDFKGAHSCIIQHKVSVTNWGGETASSGTVRVNAIPVTWKTGTAALDVPYETTVTPENRTIAALWVDGQAMHAIGWGDDLTAKIAASDATIVNTTIVPAGSGGTMPTQGGWNIWLSRWNSYAAAATSYDATPTVSGLEGAWIAISVFPTLTGGTAANIRAVCSTDVLLFNQIQRVYQIPLSIGARRDQKPGNIKAYTGT